MAVETRILPFVSCAAEHMYRVAQKHGAVGHC